MKTFYKALTANNNSYTKDRSDINVNYKLDQWVRPKINQLMVFSSLENARKFVDPNDEMAKIYECHIENPNIDGFWCSELMYKIVAQYSDDKSYRSVYKQIKNDNKLNQKRLESYYCPPKGTIFCDAIMLTKEIT